MRAGRKARAVAMAAFLLLLAAAFSAPKLLFLMQDGRVERNITLSDRGDFTANLALMEYERDDVRRLESFARGIADGTEYYCMADNSFAPSPEELSEIRKRALDANRWSNFWNEQMREFLAEYKMDWNGMLLWQEDSDREITCRRYVVYSLDGGVAFHLYYLELRGYVETIRIAMDAETDMIYYAEVGLTERTDGGYYTTKEGRRIELYPWETYWHALSLPYQNINHILWSADGINAPEAMYFSVADSYYCKVGNTDSMLTVAEENFYVSLERLVVVSETAADSGGTREHAVSNAEKSGYDLPEIVIAGGAQGENRLRYDGIRRFRLEDRFEVWSPLSYRGVNELSFVWYGAVSCTDEDNRAAVCAGIRELAGILPEELLMDGALSPEDFPETGVE